MEDSGISMVSLLAHTGLPIPHDRFPNGSAAATNVTSRMAQGDERKQSLAAWGDEPDFPDMVKALNDLRCLLLPLIRVRHDSCLEMMGFKTDLDSACVAGAAAAVADLTFKARGER
eukprot:GHVU01223780.1.p1 GENE.GHVU01223780.1~~GHVU01223780.1.p1  ORF type:complete len:116 (-),score=20.52 GHVU01223780.1:15-362(-)